MAAAVIGARTDAAGAAVVDTTSEELRLNMAMFTSGYVSSTSSFAVSAQSSPNMTVRVGSGTAKADIYVVAGSAPGQGTYVVRLDEAFVNLTIEAADSSQARVDSICLVVRDNPYDSSARALPQLAVLKGDPGAGAPVADSSWRAYLLLATVNVPAGATSISASNLTNYRRASSLAGAVGAQYLSSLVYSNGTKGRFPVSNGAGSYNYVTPPAADGSLLVSDSSSSTGLGWQAPLSTLGITKFKYLTGQESSNSTTSKDIGLTFGDPSSFVITMEPSSRYIIEYFIPFFRQGSARMVFRWGKTAAVTGYYTVIAPPFTGTSNQGSIDYRAFGLDDSQITVGPGGGGDYVNASFTTTARNPSSSAGILGLQFASDTSGTNVFIGNGAWMRYTRIA